MGSKKHLEVGLGVQGTPGHTSALLTCEGGAQLSSGGGWLAMWPVSQMLTTLPLSSAGPTVPPTVEALRGYDTDSAILLLSLKAFSFPSTREMPKPDKQNPVSPELPRCGPDRVVAVHDPLQVLRVPD